MRHGRLLFGLGAGWHEHEWCTYSYGFPKGADRMQAFKELARSSTGCGLRMNRYSMAGTTQ
jgi:alkanesulfonate monooxygenase SsuD/methylene tetrahydromethanopterin reductase-like flavin-dependent oxidoreductase (luciferase family)